LTVGAKLSPPNNGDQPLVVLSIADTGSVSRKKNHGKIFLPFFYREKNQRLGTWDYPSANELLKITADESSSAVCPVRAQPFGFICHSADHPT
jgi:hypothetical protein